MIRELGFSEARMHFMHALFEGTTQTLAAVRLQGRFELSLFQSAVDELIARHELLQCTIREQAGALIFERVGPSSTCLKVSEEPDWRAGFQVINSERLPLDRSPWAIRILLDPAHGSWELVLVTHHSLMDGHGMDRLVRELLERYGDRLRDPQARRPASIRRVPAAAEAMLPRTLSWPDFAARQAQLAGLQPARIPDPHVARAPHSERRTATLFFSLPPRHVEKLARCASEQRTTFNSWIAACLLSAVFEHSPNRSTMALNTAFSLRPLCDGLEADDLGCYVAVVPTFHGTCAGVPIADLARDHGRLLTRAIFEYARHPESVAFAAMRSTLEPLAHVRAFVHDIGYTYAETALLDRYGELTVEHFYASANRAAGTAAAVLHGVKHQGAVYFTMNYTVPLQDHAWVQQVTDELLRLLTSGLARCR